MTTTSSLLTVSSAPAPSPFLPVRATFSGAPGGPFVVTLETSKPLAAQSMSDTGGTAFAHIAGTGPSVTLTATTPPPKASNVQIEIVVPGDLGVAQFVASINGVQVGPALLTESAVVLGATGLTAGFSAGTYQTTAVYTLNGLPAPGAQRFFVGAGMSNPPAVGLTSVAITPPAPTAIIEIDLQSFGPVGIATFGWSIDGVLLGTGVVAAPAVPLGDTGIVASFAPGLYSPADKWRTSTRRSATAAQGIVSVSPPTGVGGTLLQAVVAAERAWVVGRATDGALEDFDMALAVSTAFLAWRRAGGEAMAGGAGGTLPRGFYGALA